MKIRRDTTVLDAIHPQLKHQTSAIDTHIQRKVQIIKLDPSRRREARKQRPRHLAQVGCQRADGEEQSGLKGDGGVVCGAGEHLVGDDEGLAGAEVARVGEGDCVGFRDELVFA